MLKAYYKQDSIAAVAIATQTVGEKPDTTSKTDYPLEVADKGPKLQNSEILACLDQKLAHLPVTEQELLITLIKDFSQFFPDTPGRTQIIYHGTGLTCQTTSL